MIHFHESCQSFESFKRMHCPLSYCVFVPFRMHCPPLLLRLQRFPLRSILFKVLKPRVIKRKVKIEIKNLETSRRPHNQPIMTTTRGKGSLNTLVCYVVVTTSPRSVLAGMKSPIFLSLIPHLQYLRILSPLNNSW